MSRIPATTKKAIEKILKGGKTPASPDFSGIEEPRRKRGVRYSLSCLLKLLFCGMLAGLPSLRALTSFAGRKGLFLVHCTLYYLLCRLSSSSFREALHKQVRSLDRAKALEPMEGTPFHQIAIDNKSLYYGKKKLNNDCQRSNKKSGVRFHLRALRASLVSSALRPAIDQQAMPAHTNEKGFFLEFVKGLIKAYSRGFLHKSKRVLFSADAGCNSLKNATELAREGFFYLFALKKEQRKLYKEASRIFHFWRQAVPERTTKWESRKGKQVRMKIFRTRELEGFKTTPGKWEHLQQVWCVISERRTLQGRRKSGRKKKGEKPRWGKAKVMEKRFFVTNMPLNAMSPRQCLQAVRVHWGIEGTHWVTDTQWNEDDSPWCRKGEALLVLSLLRLMAYNMISWLKCRRIRNKTMRNWSWKDWFECLKEAMAVVIRFKRKSLGK